MTGGMRRTAAVVLRHYYLMRSSIARILPIFLWILIDIALWGFISKFLNNIAGSPLNFISIFLGAVLLWDFFARVMQGVTMAFFEDVWARNFLNFFASPLSIAEYLSGLVISSTVTSAVGLIGMLIFANLAFGLAFLSFGWLIFPFLMTLFLFGIALGILSCAIVLRFGPAAEWFIWPIPAVLSPLAAVFYPLSTLPAWMQWLAHGLPPAYVFESLRAVIAGGPPSLAGLGIALALDTLYILAACWLFARTHRHAVRTGLIARYSAETVS